MKFKILTFLAFSAVISAKAISLTSYKTLGHDVGNGGAVVVCNENGQPAIKKVQLLDYYEAEVSGLKIVMDQSLSTTEKVKNLIDRVPTNKSYKTYLYKMLDNFFKEASLLPNIDLVEVGDANNIYVPKGCRIGQVAVQRKVEFPTQKRYVISKDFWDIMSDDHKAGLIFHEIIYGL